MPKGVVIRHGLHAERSLVDTSIKNKRCTSPEEHKSAKGVLRLSNTSRLACSFQVVTLLTTFNSLYHKRPSAALWPNPNPLLNPSSSHDAILNHLSFCVTRTHHHLQEHLDSLLHRGS